MDKRPWLSVRPPEGPVEREFLRPLYRGESIAPFRLLKPIEAVIPVPPGGTAPLDAKAAANDGWPRLSAWLAQCETAWERHSAKDTQSRPRMTLYRTRFSGQ